MEDGRVYEEPEEKEAISKQAKYEVLDKTEVTGMENNVQS